MEYYIEYGGGLGDVIAQMHFTGSYNFLDTLPPSDTARIALITHNPHVAEIFKWHPKAAQFRVQDFGYWSPEDDKVKRAANGILGQSTLSRPECVRSMSFHPSPDDLQVFGEIDHLVSGTNGLILLACGAGLPERNVPSCIADKVVSEANARGYVVAQIGRDYERHGRFEPRVKMAVDLINRLSVPGTLSLLMRSRGLLTGHSSMNIAAWIQRTPQLLVYPESVRRRHFVNPDQWAFGLDYPETVHVEFDDFSPIFATRFLDAVDSRRHRGLPER